MVSLGLCLHCSTPGQAGDSELSLQGPGDALYQLADTFFRCDVSNCQASCVCASHEGYLCIPFGSKQQWAQYLGYEVKQKKN